MKKKTLGMALALFGLVLLFGSTPNATAGDREPVCKPTCTATLWAGQHHDAGTVTIDRSNGYVTVTYATSGGWRLRYVHLELARSVADVPQNRGGPIPGRFRWKESASGSSHTLRIPLTMVPWDCVVVAAHAEVVRGGGEDCVEEITLPAGIVEACYTPDFGGPTFAEVVIHGAGNLDGSYGGWCVDLDRGLGDCADVHMVSSLDSAANALVDRPENLDLLNYLLNQDWSALGAGRDEIQAAIWTLIDLRPWDVGGGFDSWPDVAILERVLEIVLANGEGFVPGPNQVVGVILEPVGELQTIVIPVPIPECKPYDEETAWAGRCEFPGRNWARYFRCGDCDLDSGCAPCGNDDDDDGKRRSKRRRRRESRCR